MLLVGDVSQINYDCDFRKNYPNEGDMIITDDYIVTSPDGLSQSNSHSDFVDSEDEV